MINRTKTIIAFLAVLAVQWLILSNLSPLCAEVLQVKELLQHKDKYVNRMVEVEGIVERWVERAEQGKAGFYIMKDNFGDTVEIQTIEPNPPVGRYCRVTGLLAEGARKGSLYVQSRSIVLLDRETGKGSTMDTGGRSSSGGDRAAPGFFEKVQGVASIYTILGISALLLLVIAIFVIMSKRHHGSPLVLESPVMSLEDAKTIRIDPEGNIVSSPEPDEKTRKLMIGFFEVTDGLPGAQGQHLFIPGHFTKIGREESGKDKSKGWITFPADYITVSRHQADLIYEDDNYVLVNHAGVNSTIVNGKSLSTDEKITIQNGDRVIFGEIELTFRSSR